MLLVSCLLLLDVCCLLSVVWCLLFAVVVVVVVFVVFSLYLFHLSFYFSLLFPVLHLLRLDVEEHLANQDDCLQDGEDITITMERANDVLN